MAHHARELSLRLSDFVDEGGLDATPVDRARRAILVRHRRKGYFDQDLFCDPAWDILLNLFVAYEEKTAISASNCCAAAGLPETAAMRWIDILRERGLLTLTNVAGDARQALVRLTDPAHHAMRDFWLEQSPI